MLQRDAALNLVRALASSAAGLAALLDRPAVHDAAKPAEAMQPLPAFLVATEQRLRAAALSTLAQMIFTAAACNDAVLQVAAPARCV